MKTIFITGTDTGVGKTVITGLIARFLIDKGFSVITQKWIQTGYNFPQDIYMHLKVMGKPKSYIKEYKNLISLYNFRFPASPHLSSNLERKRINIGMIKKGLKILSNKFDFVIVEGIGGVFVPLNQKTTLIDLLGELKLPVIIVAKNKLGAINHTLLTVSALRDRKIEIVGIIFNNQKDENKIILKDNPKIIKKISKERVFGVLPFNKDIESLYKLFIPIGEKIYRCIA